MSKIGAVGSVLTAMISIAVGHALDMLRRAADAQSEIEFGLDGAARFADHPRCGQPALIDDRARGANRAAQGFGQFLGQLDVVLSLEAAAHRNQDRFLGDVHITRFRLDVSFQGHAQPLQRWWFDLQSLRRLVAVPLLRLVAAREHGHQQRLVGQLSFGHDLAAANLAGKGLRAVG